MTPVLQAAADLQAVCESQHWHYCFIGGIALQRWGEPRETVDVDLTLLTNFSGEERYIRVLMQHFTPRVPDAERFALSSRVLLLRARSGVGLDIALGGLPFEASVVARSSVFQFRPGLALRTCSAEDLVVLKAFADRPKDWVDIENILIRHADILDWDYVVQQLRPLAEAKEAPQLVDRLIALRKTV